MIEVRPDSPLAKDVAPVLARHLALMRASSPPESVHAMDGAGLAGTEVMFFSLREGAVVLGIGAIKRIDADHAEIKSMHIVSEARGRGFARLLLVRLLSEARKAGASRVSLETGTQEVFGPARSLYKAAGFAECAPFEGYEPDPNSVFMTRRI